MIKYVINNLKQVSSAHTRSAVMSLQHQLLRVAMVHIDDVVTVHTSEVQKKGGGGGPRSGIGSIPISKLFKTSAFV